MSTNEGSMRHFLHLSHWAQFTLFGSSGTVAICCFLPLLAPSRWRLRLFLDVDAAPGVVDLAGVVVDVSSSGASHELCTLSHLFMRQYHFSGSLSASTVLGMLRHFAHLSHCTHCTFGLALRLGAAAVVGLGAGVAAATAPMGVPVSL